MNSEVSGTNQVDECAWVIDGIKINLFHSAKLNILQQSKKASFLDLFSAGFGKNRAVVWYYSVDSESVIIKAGEIVIKSKIHSLEGFNFIRVPRLGLVLVEEDVLRKPKSGEAAIINRSLSAFR